MPNIFTEDVLKQAEEKHNRELQAAEDIRRAREQAKQEELRSKYKHREYAVQCLREFPAAAQARSLPLKKVNYKAPVFYNKHRMKVKMIQGFDIGLCVCITKDAETFLNPSPRGDTAIYKGDNAIHKRITLSECAEKLIHMLARQKIKADVSLEQDSGRTIFQDEIDKYCEKITEDDIRNYFTALLTR